MIFLLSEQDEQAAAAWLLRAASQSNKEATDLLGQISARVVFATADQLGLKLP
jgi:TPR repeat protein